MPARAFWSRARLQPFSGWDYEFRKPMPVMPEVLPRHIGWHAVITAGNVAATSYERRNLPIQFGIDCIFAFGYDPLVDTATDLEVRKRLANFHHIPQHGGESLVCGQ